MLRHVSTSVRHHQGTNLFLAKITCMTSVVIHYKPGKTHKTVRQIKYMNVIYVIPKTFVCKIVLDVAVYTIVLVLLLLCVSGVDLLIQLFIYDKQSHVNRKSHITDLSYRTSWR